MNNSSNTTKTYINGVWVEEKIFDNGGSILKLSILPEKFLESFKSLSPNEKGYVKLVISKKLAPGKNGDTHSIYVDDWKPKTQSSSVAAPKKSATVAKKPSAPLAQPEDDNEF
jgi:hypothetical protein